LKMRGFAVEPRLVIDASGDGNAPYLLSDDEAECVNNIETQYLKI